MRPADQWPGPTSGWWSFIIWTLNEFPPAGWNSNSRRDVCRFIWAAVIFVHRDVFLPHIWSSVDKTGPESVWCIKADKPLRSVGVGDSLFVLLPALLAGGNAIKYTCWSKLLMISVVLLSRRVEHHAVNPSTSGENWLRAGKKESHQRFFTLLREETQSERLLTGSKKKSNLIPTFSLSAEWHSVGETNKMNQLWEQNVANIKFYEQNWMKHYELNVYFFFS